MYNTHSSEGREEGENPLPPLAEKMSEGVVEPNSIPPPLSPTETNSPIKGSSVRGNVSTHPLNTDSMAIDEDSLPAVEENAPCRTTRSNVFRGQFYDGHRRRGIGRKQRYP